MSAHDPSPSLTTHLLAALDEMQHMQQKMQRELDTEKAKSQHLQEELDTSHRNTAQLRSESRSKQIATEDQPTNAPAQKSEQTTVQQSSSAKGIASAPCSTCHEIAKATGPCTIIPLEALYCQVIICKKPGLRILFSPKCDHIRFSHNERLHRDPFLRINVSNRQTRIFSCSQSVPTTVLMLVDASFPVYLRFSTPDDCSTFLETAHHVIDTTWLHDLEFRVLEATRPFLKPALATIRDHLDKNSSDPVIQNTFKGFCRMHTDKDLPSMFGGASEHANNTIRLEPRTADDCIDKISTHSNMDASNLNSNLDRLKREMTTLAGKHKSAMNEVNTRSSANSEDLNHIDGVYKSVEKDLMLKASNLEVEAAVLNDKIVQLTSHVITANASLTKKSEDGRTQSNTERAAGKRKRDVQDTEE